jgi:uncharacterized protein YwgA
MNPNIIAGLVNRAYSDFSMFSFDNRLKLQKFTYFLQHAFDLNIGYEFNWYTYGPYCMELTKDGFLANFEDTPELKFADKEAEDKFGRFLKFIERRKDNAEWLEIASSFHLLKKINPTVKEDELIEIIKNKREEFKSKGEVIKKILEELKKEGVFE